SCATVPSPLRKDVLRHTNVRSVRSFRHPVLRTVAYTNTDPCWRVGAHRRALAALAQRGASAAVRARHVERSLALFQPEDLDLLVAAAMEQITARPQEPVRLLELAVALA